MPRRIAPAGPGFF